MLFNQHMPMDDATAGILNIVCSRFLTMRQATPRRLLVLKFRNPELISQIANQGLMRSMRNGNEEEYVPNSASFAFSGDENLVAKAKGAVSLVLDSLRTLFEDEPEKLDFTYADLLALAQRNDEAVDEETLRFGLFLSQDFRVFSSWGGGGQSPFQVSNFRIAESIVTMTTAETWWNEEMSRHLGKNHSSGEYLPSFSNFELDSESLLRNGGSQGDFDWELLHPEIQKIARSRFITGHFADSVEAALKAVNERIRKIFVDNRGEERDGAALMNEAFSPKAPLLLLGDLSTASGRDMQLGYMQIFSGSMTGIRNPKAHGNVDIDANRATHFLFLASLLMYKVDEARVSTAVVQPIPVAKASAPPRRSEPMSLKPNVTFEQIPVPGGGDWQRYRLKVKIENDGLETATDYRLDVYFPEGFLDEGGHLARVQSDKPGYVLFRVTHEFHGVKRVYPGDVTGEILSFNYAIPGSTLRENVGALQVPVLINVFSGSMQPNRKAVPLSELMKKV